MGRSINEYVKNYVIKNQGNKLRLGVVEENKSAYRFWTMMGYKEINRVKVTYGLKEHIVIVMNLSL